MFYTCGPNEAMVVSGFGRSPPLMIAGGRVFVIPCIQQIQRITLNTLTLNVKSDKVYTRHGVPISVTGIAQVKIQGQNKEMLATACQMFMGKSEAEIAVIALETLEGHQRAIIAHLTVEEIYQDRKKFSEQVFKVASSDLVNMGIGVVSYTLKDVHDDQDYLHSLGKARTAQVQKDARIGEAQYKRDAVMREAHAMQEKVSAQYKNEIEMAKSQRDYELKKAAYDVEVNTKKAESEMAYQLQVAKTKQRIEEEKMQVQVVERTQQITLQEQEIIRKEMELEAKIKKPAEAEKYRLERLAEAQRLQLIMEAEAEAESIKMRGDAEAFALEAKGRAEAEQMSKKAEAFKQYKDGAMVDMLLEKLPLMAEEISKPLSEANKVTMVSSGGSEVGAAKLAGEVLEIMTRLPAAVEKLTGRKLKPVMFNPHIHQQQQQQQQQQFHQHLRQLQQLFQQQPPPPPPPQPPPGHHVPHHHHQNPRAIPVPPQTAPPPRMVNLCQATQTTLLAPNPMLQGALLMQQMQGNMRGFGMGGQQFRQFFAASSRSSLLGPVPMGMAIKTPMMGYPAGRPFHQHARYYNNAATTTASASSSSSYSSSATDAAARPPDRKRDSEQMAAGSTDDQPAASSTNEASDKSETDGAVGGEDRSAQPSEDQLEEPVVKKQRTDESEEPKEPCVTIADSDGEVLFSACNSNTEDSQPEDCIILEEGRSAGGSDVVEALEESRATEVRSCSSVPSPSGRLSEDDQQVTLPLEEMPPEEMPQDKDAPLSSPDNQEEGEEGVTEGANKFYCYLCGITCHNQQNFRSHMNSVSHQQRMMEIQHMSNACLVTLLPRVHETLQGAIKDGEKKEDLKHWCATCHTHFTSSIKDHRRTEEHRLASRTAISSCTVCKKHFRTSQFFVEHLQSLEHRQKMEKLQEKEGCEALGKLTAMDTEGFSLEEVEGSEEEEEGETSEGDQDCSEKQDGWSSLKEVTLKEMTSDEQYDPETVYGSSFFVPVAGFICRLCNKFYHFESSALHTHCKSLKHFEKLKRHKEMLSQKGEAVSSSRGSPQATDSLRPVIEDFLDETSFSEDTGLVTNVDSMQPLTTLKQLDVHTEKTSDLHISEEETTSQPAELPAGSREEPESVAEAAAEDTNEGEEEKEAPAVAGRKSGTGKEKNTPKRRSGRAANRR